MDRHLAKAGIAWSSVTNIFIPVHLKTLQHWIAMTIDLQTRTIQCYDPLEASFKLANPDFVPSIHGSNTVLAAYLDLMCPHLYYALHICNSGGHVGMCLVGWFPTSRAADCQVQAPDAMGSRSGCQSQGLASMPSPHPSAGDKVFMAVMLVLYLAKPCQHTSVSCFDALQAAQTASAPRCVC